MRRIRWVVAVVLAVAALSRLAFAQDTESVRLARKVLGNVVAVQGPRIASYAKQSSSGAPLVVNGKPDTAAVRYLSQFDDATVELTPWMQNVDGSPRTDVLMLLRRFNPRIRIWLYALVGDQWLPPSFVPQPGDHSAFRDVFDAVNKGNGWLYDTSGAQWYPNYRVNLADSATVRRLGDVYVRLISLHLVDGFFADDCSTSISWTNNSQPQLDVKRAGFPTMAAMDSARLANAERLIARLHEAGGCGFLVAVNGTGPTPKGCDVTFREALLSLTSVQQATDWMSTPGTHWLEAALSCSPDYTALIRSIGAHGTNAIISSAPGRAWPPCLLKP